MGLKWIASGLGLIRDGMGVYNEYTIGKGLRQNMGDVNVLIPTLMKALGAQQTAALISSYALPAGAAMLGVVALQGRDASAKLGKIYDTLDAQTALDSAEKFAWIIWRYLKHRIEETQDEPGHATHWFFVYHPDTNWHSEFHNLSGGRRKLERLIGISHSLPHLCYFMMHIRTYLREKGAKKPIVFHLLMPAYRRIYIEEKLAFNPALYPLKLEGHIYDSAPFVNLRVVNKEKRNAFRISGINNMPPDEPGGFWNLWNIFASEPRTLDLGVDDAEDYFDDSDADYDSDSSGHGSTSDQLANIRGNVSSRTHNDGRATRKSRPYIETCNGKPVLVRRRPRRDATV